MASYSQEEINDMTINLAATTDAVNKAPQANRQQPMQKTNEPETVSIDDTMSVAEHEEKLRIALKAQKAELNKKHAQAIKDAVAKSNAKHVATVAVLTQNADKSHNSVVDILHALTDAGMKRIIRQVKLREALDEAHYPPHDQADQSEAAVRSAMDNADEAHKEHMAALKVAHERLQVEMRARESKERILELEDGMSGICIPN